MVPKSWPEVGPIFGVASRDACVVGPGLRMLLRTDQSMRPADSWTVASRCFAVVLAAAMVASCQGPTASSSASPQSGSTVLVDRQNPGDTGAELLKTIKSHTELLHQIKPSHSWTLQWSFNCSNIGGQPGYFGIYLHGSKELPVLVVAWNTQKSGVVAELKAGTYTVEVSSLCGWHVAATEAQTASHAGNAKPKANPTGTTRPSG
jgi:hypothetical protein